LAEALGLAVGLVGLPAAVNGWIDFFRIGRKFDQGFSNAILKLDIASISLARWGKSIGVFDDAPNGQTSRITLTEDEKELQAAMKLIGSIDDLSRRRGERQWGVMETTEPPTCMLPTMRSTCDWNHFSSSSISGHKEEPNTMKSVLSMWVWQRKQLGSCTRRRSPMT
jgi:hypothetical protein